MTTLTGCADLGFGSREKTDTSKAPKSSLPVEEIAVKLLNSVTFFPELNDDLDLSEYVELDPGFGYTLKDYTFSSSNDKVIRIENYHATCIGEGYAEVTIAGPKIPADASLSFYVGSIAGTYSARGERAIEGKFTIEIGEADPVSKESNVNVTILEGASYNKTSIPAYQGTATYVKDRSPFLNLTFADEGPSGLVPISAYLSTFGVNAEDFDITTNIYGLMSYDEEYGLEIKMMLNDFPISIY